MLESRTSETEILDSPNCGLEAIEDTFRFLAPVNQLFGGIWPVIRFFRRESKAWDRERTYHILDAGSGIADVPIALARWARRSGYSIAVHGVDWNPIVIELSRPKCESYPEITLTCADVMWLVGEYDYVHASQFVHHFPDGEVVGVLRHLLGLCRSKLVVNDLIRAPFHYALAWVFSLFASPVFRHDSRISVKRGFRISELKRLMAEGGFATYEIEIHWLYRFLLILEVYTSSGSEGVAGSTLGRDLS
jgi:SAM-dependent methyltransferase